MKLETSLNPSAFDVKVSIDGLMQHKNPNKFEMISSAKKL
jgi:hypothetical protein